MIEGLNAPIAHLTSKINVKYTRNLHLEWQRVGCVLGYYLCFCSYCYDDYLLHSSMQEHAILLNMYNQSLGLSVPTRWFINITQYTEEALFAAASNYWGVSSDYYKWPFIAIRFDMQFS